MTHLVRAIPTLRRSVVSILRIHATNQLTAQKGDEGPVKVNCSFGSGFCVGEDRIVVTAYHLLNEGRPCDPLDRFVAFIVPDNGEPAFHFPVIGFPVLRPDLDLAVLEIGPCETAGIHIPALPVTFESVPDGSHVVTVGYPSPEISGINVDADLNYRGGQFFLKSHANEGIVAAQYLLGGKRMYELNVGWHHGESGGPVATAESEPVVFALMQHYRNVQSPHGVAAGPHRGFALSAVQNELGELGVFGV